MVMWSTAEQDQLEVDNDVTRVQPSGYTSSKPDLTLEVWARFQV